MHLKTKVLASMMTTTILILFFAAGFLVQSGTSPISSIGPIALVPQKAARDMLNNRGIIQDFSIVKLQPWNKGRLVVHNYSVLSQTFSRKFEFGYALVELRAGGWSVFEADLHEAFPTTTALSYASRATNNTLLVYGRTFDPKIKTVEVITASPSQSLQTDVINNGFAIVIPNTTSFQELRVLDQSGQILKIYYEQNWYKSAS